MGGNKRNSQTSASEKYGEIFNAAKRSEKFRLSGKLKTDIIHVSIMNWSGNDRIDLARKPRMRRFLEGNLRGTRAPGSRFA